MEARDAGNRLFDFFRSSFMHILQPLLLLLFHVPHLKWAFQWLRLSHTEWLLLVPRSPRYHTHSSFSRCLPSLFLYYRLQKLNTFSLKISLNFPRLPAFLRRYDIYKNKCYGYYCFIFITHCHILSRRCPSPLTGRRRQSQYFMIWVNSFLQEYMAGFTLAQRFAFTTTLSGDTADDRRKLLYYAYASATQVPTAFRSLDDLLFISS